MQDSSAFQYIAIGQIHEPAVNALLSQADKLATLSKAARATDQDVTRYTGRLGKSALRKDGDLKGD